MERARAGHYLAGLAIIFAVFALLFFVVYADRSAPGPKTGPLTEQTKP